MIVSIDTDADEFEDAVRALYAAYGHKFGDRADTDIATSASSNSATILPGGWSEKKLRKWAGLLNEGAQEIVRYIATNAPEVSFDDAAKHFGKFKGLRGPAAGNVVGGVMSSGGHALNRLRGAPKDQPLDRNADRRVYLIDEQIAAILVDELGAPSA